jgi:uncharacterized repeat protein (TIGR02543 family)
MHRLRSAFGAIFAMLVLTLALQPQAAQAAWAQATGTAGIRFTSMVKVGTTIFAGKDGGGLYQSTDDGLSWGPAFSTTFDSWGVSDVRQIGSKLFVVGNILPGGTNGNARVAYSSDSGVSWTVSPSIAPLAWYVADITEMNGAILLNAFPAAVYKSIDAGVTWSLSNAGMTAQFAPQRFAKIGTTIFVVDTSTNNSGVWKSVDSGSNWTRPANAGLPSISGGFSRLINYNGTLFLTGAATVWRSLDSGENWTQSTTSGVDLAINNGTLYLSKNFDNELVTTVDNGTTWDVKDVSTIDGGNAFLQPGIVVSAGKLLLSSGDGIWRETDPAPTYALTVTPPTNGSVASGTGGISCGASCAGYYLPAASVVLTATPASGSYVFSSWGGDCSGSTNPLAVTMSASKACTATFASASHTVTFDNNGGSGTMTAQVGSGATNLTTNTLTKTGYTFAGWNTASGGSGTAYANSASYPFATSTTLYAQWTINSYTVTFDANTGTGTMTAQSANYNVATALTANTLSKTGYTFAGWNTVAGGGGTAYANSASYAFTASTTLYAQWTSAAVNGACATIAATAFVPTTGLCTQGTAPSSATTGSPWTWSCTGSGGGTTASCSAPNAATATGSGTGRASISGGTWVVDAANSGFVATSTVPSLPPGTTFPHGLLNLKLTTGVAGTSATVLITYPSALPAGTVYWKYGRTASNTSAHWYQFAGAAISGSTITLTLTDGADGDDDYTANSVITDPGGPGVPATTTVAEPITLEVPVVPLIPPLASLPAIPGVGNGGRAFLNLAEGAGPSMTGCLRTTLNDILGPDWLYQGQSADGGSRLSRATDIISFYPIEANTNTTYGLGQGSGIYLRNTNPLSVVTGCGTFLTAPALYSLGEFGALLNDAGLIAQINAQGVMTVQVGSLTYVARPDYLVTQGTPGAPSLSTGTDGLMRFTDSTGHIQILYPAFLDPEVLGNQVALAVSGYLVIQTDGTALVTLLSGEKFVLTPDLTLGTVPPEFFAVGWWQDGPNHYRYRNSSFSNTSQGFSVRLR